MTKEEATNIVLTELLSRLPKTNLEGFLAEPEVYAAIKLLREKQ